MAVQKRALFVVNEAYFFLSHRLPMARAAQSLGLEVHVAAPEDHVWAPEGFDVRSLKDLGFRYHPLPVVRRGRNPIQDIRTLAQLHSVVQRVRPVIMQNMTIKPVIYGGLAARFLAVPALVSLITGLGHIFVSSRPADRLLRQGLIQAYRLALRHPNSCAVFQNPDDREHFVNLRIIDCERAQLIRGSGVSLDDFRYEEEPPEPVVILLPARLIWEKGIDSFVAAARTLKQESPATRFILVGDTQPSNPRAVPIADLERWQQGGVIEWWGRQADMPRIFAQSHIVCFPSRYGEGIPKTLIEAAACGRPIVTTDTSGCREVVRDGENGLLVASGDGAGLVAALRRLIAEPSTRKAFGQCGRKIAEAEFSETLVEEQTRRIFQALITNEQAA